MDINLWLGAATTLIGAVIGGTLSFVLSRQQMKDARAQRMENDAREERRRTMDRRFEAYADFITHARAYRTAIRPHSDRSSPTIPVDELDALARAADQASSIVFLVLQSKQTFDACRQILKAVRNAQDFAHTANPANMPDAWAEHSKTIANLLRRYQVAVRSELDVTGLNDSVMLE